jgi:hypothetical protein
MDIRHEYKLSSSGTELWSYCLNLNPDWDGGIDKLQNSDNYISIYNDATTGNSEIRNGMIMVDRLA